MINPIANKVNYMVSRPDVGKTLNLEIDLLPEGVSNRPGTKITPSFITIHNTDNTNTGADARAHATYMKGPDARARKVSWHYTVDDQRCVKHLPTDEKGWHASTSDGNNQSIGIEICMNSGIDQATANRRAA
ncbi:MAG: N-acetylmuramoyl-L-alanine amidase, partial [Merismopediaceae bacterium]|nr:N-acetylmuramoyl-L-alanine amidase [Merismopediaceae bacterium]